MHRIKRWISAIVLCAIMLTSAPFALAETRTGKVRTDLGMDTVEVYKAKRAEADQLDETLKAGTAVKILEDDGDGWYYIEYERENGEKHKAYVPERMIKVNERSGNSSTPAPQATAAPEDAFQSDAGELETFEPSQEAFEATPTEAPTPEPTAEPTAEPTPEPTAQSFQDPVTEPTFIVEEGNTPAPVDSTPPPVQDVMPSPEPEPTFTVDGGGQGELPEPMPSAQSDPTPLPEPTFTPEDGGDATPEPFATPDPAATADPDGTGVDEGQLWRPDSSITTLTATINTGANNREAGLYREMNTASLVKSYPNGDTVTVLERGDPWCRVLASDGNTGYMLLLYLSFDAVPGTNETATVTTGNNAISIALFNAKTDTAPMATYANGTIGKLIEREATWCKLEMPDGRSGYIKTAFLTLTTGNATDVSTINTGGSATAGLYTAKTDATPVAGYPTGTRIRVLENDGTWSRVDMPDGRTGYIKNAFIQGASGATETGQVNTGNNTVGVGLFTNKTDTAAVATYANGTVVRVLQKEATWCYVEMPDGRIGYIKTAFLTLSGSPLAETAIVRPAASGSSAGLYATTNDALPFISYTTGTVARVLEKGATWYRIEMPDGNVGYMRVADLNVSAAPVTTATVQTAGGLLAGLFLDVTNATPFASYANGTTAKVLEKSDPWCRVEMPDGKVGYMKTADLYFGGTTPTTYAYVTLPTSTQTLPLYDRESTSGAILGSYFNGQIVSVVSWGNNGWALVEVSGKRGYMQTAFLTLSPAPNPTPTDQYATVHNANPSHWLNLRLYPDKDAVILGQYYNGTVVRVLEKGPVWCRVEVDGLTGYMMTEFLVFQNQPGPSPGPVTQYAKVANQNPTHRLNLRAQPSTSSASLGRYYNGTIVKILEYNTVWCRVEVDGIVGYMMTRYLSLTSDGGGGGGGSTIGYALVNNPDPREHLNLRASPSKSATILGKYYNGTSVRVLEHGPIWCRVEVSGRYGYMMTQFLSFTNSPGTGGGTGGGTSTSYATVNSNARLNLREGPSKSSRSLGQFYHGTRVRVIEYNADWCRVEVQGIYGYMMTQYLSFGTTITNPTIGIVKNALSTQRLPLYAFPDTTSLTLGTYPDGTVMEILSYGTSWSRVKVGTLTGYVMTQYLQLR